MFDYQLYRRALNAFSSIDQSIVYDDGVTPCYPPLLKCMTEVLQPAHIWQKERDNDHVGNKAKAKIDWKEMTRSKMVKIAETDHKQYF